MSGKRVILATQLLSGLINSEKCVIYCIISSEKCANKHENKYEKCNLEQESDSINYSEQISNFLSFLTTSQTEYNYSYEEVNRLDKLTQDYLHQLELDNLKCAERSKVATRLAVCRKDRRYYKDKVEELQPLIDFLGEAENKKVIEKLKRVLGETKKQESGHENRFYVPRVLKEK